MLYAGAGNDDNVNVCLWHVTLDKYQKLMLKSFYFWWERVFWGEWKKNTLDWTKPIRLCVVCIRADERTFC